MSEPTTVHATKPQLTPLKIAGIYAVVAALWTAFSDHLVGAIANDPALIGELHTYKGWFFVLVTAIALYALIQRSNESVRRSEDARRESEQRLQAILENSTSIAIYVKDTQGHYLLVNRLFETVFDRPAEQIVGRSGRDFLPVEVADAILANDQRVIAAGIPMEFEEAIPQSDGMHTYLSVKFPLCDDSGVPYAVCGIDTDITERKRMEEALRESEDRFRDVTEAASDWIWEMDEELRFTHLSERFWEITGISPGQVLGHTRWELASDETDREKWQRHREILEARLPFREFVYQTQIADRHGHRHHFKISGKPIFDASGRFRGYRGTGADITEQVEAEAALRESQRALATLLSNLPGMAYRGRNDREWTMDFVSTGATKLTGYAPADLIDNKKLAFGELIHPADRTMVWSKVQEALREQRPYQLTYRIRTASGEEKWAWEQGCGVFSRDGEIRALEGLILDITEQKRAERALQESEERNRLIIDTALDAVVTIDANGVVIGWNAQARAVFGYSRPEILRRRLSESIIPLQYREAHERGLQYFLSTGQGPLLNKRFEITALHRQGHEFPVELSIVPLRTGGKITFSAFVRDISERKEAEERLRQSEEKLRLTLEYAPIGIATTDLAGHLLSVNPAFCTILGYTAEELLRMTVQEITHPEDIDRTRERYRALVRGKIPSYQMEKRYIRKDGSVITGYARTGLVRDANGKPLLVVGEVEDITERKRTEEEMMRMRLYLKNIIDSMPSVLVGVDPDGAIIEWNQQAETATGLSRSEAQGRPFKEVFPQLEAQLEQVRQAIQQRQPIKTQRLTSEVDGEIHYSDVMVYPLIANGAFGAVIRVDDVTARVRIEDMMVQTEKMLSVGGLAAGMAHEINNPLGAILQGSQNILRRLSPDMPKNREVAESLNVDLKVLNRYLDERGILHFLRGIHEAGTRAAKIVTDMLAFSRRSESRFTHVDLREILDTVVRLAASDYDLKKRYDFKHINIVRDYDPDLGPVYCDKTQIEQVILNLIKNATQAMSGAATPSPTIALRLRKEAGFARIEVTDNGPGMEERIRMRVFEPFFTTKEVGVGTGLGLSVSYFIVTEQHKGTLSVISTPGQGARFIIRLPLAAQE